MRLSLKPEPYNNYTVNINQDDTSNVIKVGLVLLLMVVFVFF